MNVPEEHIKDHYKPVIDPILDGFEQVLALNKPAYLVIKMSRGLGKTFDTSKVLAHLASKNYNFNILSAVNTKIQLNKILEKSNYLADHGVTEEEGWSHNNSGYSCIKTKSDWIFETIADKAAIERIRGMHQIKFIYQEEAQEVRNYIQWMEVFSKIGRVRNSIKILVGTGSKYENSLIQHVEGLIKAGAVPGIIVEKTVYDVYKEDPCQYWKAYIDEEEKLARGFLISYNMETGEDELTTKFDKAKQNPSFLREILVKHVQGSSEEEVAFPMFSDDNILKEDYLRDPNSAIFSASDYGSNDPYGSIFAQVRGEEVVVFAEMFNDTKSHRNMGTFAYDLALKMDELGIATLSMRDIETQDTKYRTQRYDVEFNHGEIYFFGDDHGRTNWNIYLAEYFNIGFDGVDGAAEDGLDIIKQFLITKQLKIHESCFNLISHLTMVKTADEKNKQKFHLSIDHNKSHLIAPLSYLLIRLVENNIVPILRTPIEKKEIKKVKSEKRKIIFPITKESLIAMGYPSSSTRNIPKYMRNL